MKKVGILTTYFSKNYGAALQAYALQMFLEKNGYDAEFVPYQSRIIQPYICKFEQEKIRKENLIGKIIRRSRNLRIKLSAPEIPEEYVVVRALAFARFVNEHLKIGAGAYHGSDAFKRVSAGLNYDAYICGSDQVWNPMVHAFDPIYFLDFPTQAKKIAYAPSIACADLLDDEEIRKIVWLAEKLDALSVRETSARNVMQKYTDCKVEAVIDPTFLLEKTDWLKLKSDIKLPKKYVLVYILNYNASAKQIFSIVSDYARSHGCEIVCLPYTKVHFKDMAGVHMMYDVAPNDFMQLLAGAECIFTNSFHASALSMNLNKCFYVVSSSDDRTGLHSRIRDLISKFGLEKRMIDTDSAIDLQESSVDYNAVNRIIERERAHGASYLMQVLGDLK